MDSDKTSRHSFYPSARVGFHKLTSNGTLFLLQHAVAVRC